MRFPPYRDQKVTIISVIGDADGDRYKRDFLDVLKAAHWSFNEMTDVASGVFMPSPEGVQVTVNAEDAKLGRVLKSAYIFVLTLHKLGIVDKDMVFANPDVPSGQVEHNWNKACLDETWRLNI